MPITFLARPQSQQHPALKTYFTMSLADTRSASIMATAAAPGAPGLMTQIGMAGGAAVITVTFIHPIDVVKVCN